MQLLVENLSKSYRGGVQALCDVQLPLSAGVLGLLGPKGAGKSTFMRILATVTQPSAGRVLWNGKDVAADPDSLRDILGYLPQDFGVYPNLSALEFLEYLDVRNGAEETVMKRMIVRYKVQAGKAEENERYILKVFEELHKNRPEGLIYASFKLSDGVSFVHIVSVETADDRNLLVETTAFKTFNAGIKDRCEEQPVLMEMTEVGSYRFFAK